MISTSNPFLRLSQETIHISCASPTFGLEISRCPIRCRPYISDIGPGSLASTLCSSHRRTKRKYLGAFIVSVNNVATYTAAEVHAAFASIRSDSVTSFTIGLAPEALPNAKARADSENLTLGVDQLRAIHAIRSELLGPESMTDPVSDDDLELLLHALSSTTGSPAERALGSFTRRKLRNLDTWPLWKSAELKQLDGFADLAMYGEPCPRPPDAIVLRQHWMYKIKSDGTRRARNCCDGSKRAAPELHRLSSTYSSCIEHPCMRLFMALSASLNMQILAADARDAYAHSSAPSVPTYVVIDDAYAEWYFERNGIQLDRSMVLPVRHALQGHPEAGALWETHINHILTEVGFTSTTHERNIYQMTYKDHRILLCRQVDDFCISCTDPVIADEVLDKICAVKDYEGKHIDLVKLGICTAYNGLDVSQTRDYTALSVSTYIQRLLLQHGWETPSLEERKPGSKPFEPISPSIVPDLDTVGPSENTSEHAALQTQYGFSYRGLLGELIYAYVVCRLDIGYAITLLARFSAAPAKIHYQALRRVAIYLRHTADWSLIYWRPKPCLAFEPGSHTALPSDPSLPRFPSASSPLELTGFVDASHATCLRTRRSVTGFCLCLAGAAVAYKTKVQPTVATSSTEAELIAAVHAAKVTKYLRTVLRELGFPPTGPTILHEDNQAAINMINASRPTERARHIDIQHFAIQEWRQRGDIIMQHLPGIINPADQLTKNLGWILHSRHARRSMGHYGLV
jgi:hypothetical protein